MRFILLLFLLFILCGCKNSTNYDVIDVDNKYTNNKNNYDIIDSTKNKNAKKNDSLCLDSILLKNFNLVNIRSIDSSIKVSIKYATTDNFTHQKLYFHISNAYLQKNVAQRLSKCQKHLKTIHPEYSLIIYDAVRPLSVQQKIWDLLDTIPINLRTKFVSNPKNHSIHNYGCAVDLTIIDQNGVPLDMGSFYDDIRRIAYPKLELHFLQTGELTQQQVDNRKLLRKVMKVGGFSHINTEWWHFNAHSRNYVKKNYPLLLDEPQCNN